MPERHKKITLNLRLYAQEKEDIVNLAETLKISAADLLTFCYNETRINKLNVNRLHKFLIKRHYDIDIDNALTFMSQEGKAVKQPAIDSDDLPVEDPANIEEESKPKRRRKKA